MDPASSTALAGPPVPALADALALPAAALTLLAEMGPAGVAAGLGALLLLLALSALFSGSEVALFSITPAEREALAEGDESHAARRVLRLLERARALLVSLVLLDTLARVGAAILSATLALEAAEALGWSATAALALQVVVLTFVLLVVSEIAPKATASRQPVRFAKAAMPLLYPLARGLHPVSSLLAAAMARLQALVRGPAERRPAEDLKTMADVGEGQGSIEEEERALIHSILEFGEITVREVMVSRLDVIALPETATLGEALALIRESGHSRFPLYRDHLDHVLGVVYAKDLLPYLGDDHDPAQRVDWAALARQPRFVPLSKTLDAMLADFQQHNTHMALVVDEYGGTAGIVTLEDLLEEVVGEIRDELDEPDEALYRAVGPAAWRVEARIHLDDLAEALGVEIDTEAFDFETLGGLIFHLTGAVPAPGDEVRYGRLQLRVEDVEQNRIRDVLVTLLPEPEPAREA
ncbi:MAG TPA: hemolysin family protein [Rubricoccaceae bacterium]|nr:hemolysin family protein [Rubricoccaceae bacterium]